MSMYGDLVNALVHTVFAPVYVYDYARNPELGHGAAAVAALWAISAPLCWISWCTNSSTISMMIVVVMAVDSAYMNILQWPYEGANLVTPQSLWALLIASGNTRLSFQQQTIIGVFTFVEFSIIAAYSPVTSLSAELPSLLSFAAAHILFHYFQSTLPEGTKRGMLSAESAMIALAGTMTYHTVSECIKMMENPSQAQESGLSIVKAGLFVSVGFMSSGAFRKQVDAKVFLEGEVQKRTEEIQAQAEQLRIVGLALQASETAICICDSEQRITWCNTALRRVAKKARKSSSNRNLSNNAFGSGITTTTTAAAAALGATFKLENQSIVEALHLDQENSRKLCNHWHNHRQSSCSSSDYNVRQDEIVVQDNYFIIDVSPFPMRDGHAENRATSSFSSSDHDEPPIYKKATSSSKVPDQRYLVVLKDITEKRAREQAELAAEREKVQKAAMSESIETLSHELRTPLQGIMGMSSLLVEDGFRSIEETKEMMSMVMASSRLLLTLINNLLDIRKCDAHMMQEFNLDPIPLEQSMRQVADFCIPVASVTNVKVGVMLDTSDDIMVLSNPVRFQQVMINLVSNAIKYTPEDSNVWLITELKTVEETERLMKDALVVGIQSRLKIPNLRQNDTVAVVSVQDSGRGIPEGDKAARLFSRFQQLNQQTGGGCGGVVGGNTVAQPSGTGLGLNLCLKFVDRMHGNIWVTNGGNGGGACFSFYLPVVVNVPVPALGRSKSVDKLVGMKNGESKVDHHHASTMEDKPKSPIPRRVLVVDDTIINLKVMSKMLLRAGVEQVDTVDCGLDALESLASKEFDLIISDIQMPEMSGTELSAIIRDRWSSSAPIVVGLTAETSESLAQRCSDNGMSHVLYKPITAKQIQQFFASTLPYLTREPKEAP